MTTIKLIISVEEAKLLVGQALNTTLIGKKLYKVAEVEWNKYDTEATFILESIEPPAQPFIDDRDRIA